MEEERVHATQQHHPSKLWDPQHSKLIERRGVSEENKLCALPQSTILQEVYPCIGMISDVLLSFTIAGDHYSYQHSMLRKEGQ